MIEYRRTQADRPPRSRSFASSLPNQGQAWELALGSGRALLRRHARPNPTNSTRIETDLPTRVRVERPRESPEEPSANLLGSITPDGQPASASGPARCTARWPRSPGERRPSARNPSPLDEVADAGRPPQASQVGDHPRETLAEIGSSTLPAVTSGTDAESLLIGPRGRWLEAIADLVAVESSANLMKIRCHGDYHLGQLLLVEGEFLILDFEGEPGRSAPGAPGEALAAPRRGVDAALARLRCPERPASKVGSRRPRDASNRLEPWANLWRSVGSPRSSCKAYRAGVAASLLPDRLRWSVRPVARPPRDPGERRCLRCATSWITAPTGSRSRFRGFWDCLRARAGREELINDRPPRPFPSSLSHRLNRCPHGRRSARRPGSVVRHPGRIRRRLGRGPTRAPRTSLHAVLRALGDRHLRPPRRSTRRSSTATSGPGGDPIEPVVVAWDGAATTGRATHPPPTTPTGEAVACRLDPRSRAKRANGLSRVATLATRRLDRAGG